MSTLDVLEQLSAEAPAPQFNRDMEPMLISCLLDFPHFVAPQYLKPEFFETGPARVVIATILNYLEANNTVPTRLALRAALAENVTVDDQYEDVFALVDRPSDPREVPFVKDKYQAWLRNKAFGQLFADDAIEAWNRGDYAALTNLVAQANLLSSPLEGEPFDFLDASGFLAEEIHMEWLINGMLVANQPCIVGGKDKCLKTGTICDLALSLATGTKFLDHFDVPKPRRVAFFSAESGKLDIQRRFKAILTAKGVELPPDMLKISFTRPQLSNLDDLLLLGKMIERYKAEVVIVDPLYLTLLAGDDTGASASDLYSMGNKFGTLADVIAKAGATAILVHHYKKTTEEGVLGLNEFTFTGASAFARQSLHIGRRKPYSGPTTNQMRFMNHGFASGQTYALDIDEQTWTCQIQEESEAIINATANKYATDVQKLVAYLTDGGQATLTKIEKAEGGLGWRKDKTRRVIDCSGGQVVLVEEEGKRWVRLAQQG